MSSHLYLLSNISRLKSNLVKNKSKIMFNNQSNSRIPKPVKGLFFLAFMGLMVFLLGQVIMFLWNEILVEVTGFQTITFWQGLGIFALTRILFGGFRFGPKHRRWRDKRNKWRDEWKAELGAEGGNWKEKWMGMSDGERAEFKRKWKERCRSRE